MIRANCLRFVAVVFVAVFALSLTGCGASKITKSNYDLIDIGMKEAVVEAILGKGEARSIARAAPDKSDKIPGSGNVPVPGVVTCKEWQEGTKSISIQFLDGKVTMKGQNGL